MTVTSGVDLTDTLLHVSPHPINFLESWKIHEDLDRDIDGHFEVNKIMVEVNDNEQVEPKPTYMTGWTKQELTTLDHLLRTEPLGKWTKHVEKLTAKDKDQIISKVQRLLGRQSLKDLKGKRIRLKGLHNCKAYEVNRDPKQRITVNHDDAVYEVLEDPDDVSVETTFNRDLRQLECVDKSTKRAKEWITDNKEALHEILENDDTKRINPYTEEREHKKLMQCKDAKVTWFKDNHYRVLVEDDCDFVYYFKHPESKTIAAELKPNDDGQRKLRGTEILLTDPPWRYLNSNPTRGPKIIYKTEKDKRIFQTLEQFMPKRMLAIFVVAHTTKAVFEWLTRVEFTMIHQIDIVKKTVTGRLKRTLGYYFQHSYDRLILAIPKRDAHVMENVQRNTLPNTIERTWQTASAKPKDVHYMLEEIVNTIFNEDRGDLNISKSFGFTELYARDNNVTRNWTHLGNELSTTSRIKEVFIEKQEIPTAFRV